ncbi:hypothetical protein ACP70R_032328 [Stipagrostis hirtigluma subsp. patula]
MASTATLKMVAAGMLVLLAGQLLIATPATAAGRHLLATSKTAQGLANGLVYAMQVGSALAKAKQEEEKKQQEEKKKPLALQLALLGKAKKEQDDRAKGLRGLWACKESEAICKCIKKCEDKCRNQVWNNPCEEKCRHENHCPPRL